MDVTTSFIKKYVQFAPNLFAENKTLKFAIAAMATGMVGMAVVLMSFVSDQKVYLVPIESTGDYWVSGEEASEDYLSRVTKYILYSLGNIQASNVKDNFADVLKYVHPRTYDGLREKLKTIADDIMRYPSVRYTITVADRKDAFLYSKDQIKVKAVKTRYSGPTMTETGNVEYTIHYQIDHGQFYITDILEERKNDV